MALKWMISNGYECVCACVSSKKISIYAGMEINLQNRTDIFNNDNKKLKKKIAIDDFDD